ncbi:MAG TPA: ABC transporter substrate-binding protein [Syntrophorhabdus sp.]|nr:ABC transporter substrate-binding protein [Syntrophorhabdus sp.]
MDKRQIGPAMIKQKLEKQLKPCKVLYTLSVCLLAVLASAIPSHGTELTDMFGRQFSIPDRPQKVYSPSPPITNLLYAIDPVMIAGLTVPIREHEKPYLRKEMQLLPVLGGWFGVGNVPNLEMILKINPELIITWKRTSAVNVKVDQTLKTMPIPVISLTLDTIWDYPAAFLYLGKLLGREARGDELAAYARRTLSEMKELAAPQSAKKKVLVYYAEGVDGLSTECHSSLHAELIPLAGGYNVHRCQERNPMGMEKISFEQVMLHNPDVILVMENVFYKSVFSDPRWQRIKAVKNKKVYLIPNQPFNWFDRPPSFMRLLGAKWLANILYPERYHANMVKETQEFFKLFLGIDLNAREAKAVLRQ